ncbi:MAG: glycosyl hydrolase, partial [Verrucomicrobia bacterium]|nr:glycosyl hydrolase [Verrucomicrobiota bacterium]
LPDLGTMRPAVLKKIRELVSAGAVILGPRPLQSPSLRDLGEGDQTVRRISEELWGAVAPGSVDRAVGQGRVFANLSFEEVFQRLGLLPDFELKPSSADAEVLYCHRRIGEAEVYFVSNQRKHFEEVMPMFRVSNRAPELWDPSSGVLSRPGLFQADGVRMQVPLRLEPFGSVFVVFRAPVPKRYAVEIVTTQQESESARSAASPLAASVESAQETFTLSVWVKPDEEIPLPAERKAAVAFQGQNWAVFPEPGHQLYGEGHAGCGIAAGRNGICVFEHSARYAPAVISYPVEIKEWTHVALVYEQRVPRLFVNGRDVRHGAKGPHTVHASMGKSGANSRPKFRGQILALKLVDRALTETEIAALAANHPGALPAVPSVELELAASGNLLARCWDSNGCEVVLNDGTRAAVKPQRPTAAVEVTGPWRVSFAPGLGAPASAQFDKLISWSEHKDPGIRFFSGQATYQTIFHFLGEVAIIAEVRLNGSDLGILWKPPFRVCTAGVARPGRNELEVRVINLWPNRMIGDAGLLDDIEWQAGGRRGPYPAKWPDWLVQGTARPSGRISFCTRKDVYTKNDPLLPSGLLGPVRLRTAVLHEMAAPVAPKAKQ